jgi:hypothetical protein
MVSVDVVLTEQQMAEDFLSGLRERNLAEKFFYWFPLSVQAWLELCKDGEYRNFIRSYQLVARHAEEIAAALPGSLEIVSLGAGQGNKDAFLLRAACARAETLTYRPVDSSQALIELACQAAVAEGVDCRGLKLDVDRKTHWVRLAPNGTPRLYVVLGNTLGAFDPPEFLERLRSLLRREDRVLLDGEIFSSDSLQGYDNKTNRRFAFAPLASIGISEADGALRFETHEDSRLAGLHYFSKHFEPARDIDLHIGGAPLSLERGMRLRMSPTYKYSRAGFTFLLQEVGRLEIESEYLSDDGRFLMVLARAA